MSNANYTTHLFWVKPIMRCVITPHVRFYLDRWGQPFGRKLYVRLEAYVRNLGQVSQVTEASQTLKASTNQCTCCK